MKRKLVSLLLCVAMVATLAAGCGSGSGDSKDSSKEDSKKTEEKKDEGTKEVSTDTVFGKALAQVNEDLAPLPEKDTGKKLAAIESTLTNSFWVTMQEGYEDTAEEYGVSIDAVSYTHLSEAMLIDLDGDGEEELFTMLPFHGDTIRIYKKCGNAYAAVYEYPEKLEFLHAISGGNISGEPTVVVGHRKGERRLLAFRSDKKGGYTAECLDEHTGAANLLHYTDGSKEMLLATNREIDEIAMYTLQEKE